MVLIAQRLVGPSKQLKQIIQSEHNVGIPTGRRQTSCLFTSVRGRGFERGATVKQIQVVVRVGFESETAGLRVRRSVAKTTRE